jgi:hypothetical protein
MHCRRLMVALRPPHCRSKAHVGAKLHRLAEVYLNEKHYVMANYGVISRCRRWTRQYHTSKCKHKTLSLSLHTHKHTPRTTQALHFTCRGLQCLCADSIAAANSHSLVTDALNDRGNYALHFGARKSRLGDLEDLNNC